MVSDSDGAVAALAIALKLASMRDRGDALPGDVLIGTHICPDAPTIPHDPVPFMGPPVDMVTMNQIEVRDEMDVVLSIDATKGNRLVNHKGIAITPTVKDGWVLPVAPDLLDLYEQVTGRPPVVVPLSTYNITPTATTCSTSTASCNPRSPPKPPWWASPRRRLRPPRLRHRGQPPQGRRACRHVILEVAKAVGAGRCEVYDEDAFQAALGRYGPLSRLRTMGEQD